MRKPDFACAKTKAKISLCFRYTDCTILLQTNIKLLGILSDFTDQFVSDLVRNLEDRFFPIAAHLKPTKYLEFRW